jgi:hypothetical protein
MCSILKPDTWKDNEKLNDMDNADLIREFTEAEVKDALFCYGFK